MTGVYSREIIYMFFMGQVSGLVENFNIGIYSDTINVINVKLCMMVLHIELYLFIPLFCFSTRVQGSLLKKNFMLAFSQTPSKQDLSNLA